MKTKIFACILAFLASLTFQIDAAFIDRESYQVIMIKFNIDDFEDLDFDRSPSSPKHALIDRTHGVSIAGNSDLIETYEIWDAEGTICLSSSTEEEEFLKDFFAQEGEYQLRFYAGDYLFMGNISTLK